MPRIELTELERKKLSEAAALSYQTPLSWRDIETAPKDGKDVLLANDEGLHVGWWSMNEWRYKNFYVSIKSPTHWQPLPEPPTGE
jgi:hypothetical protein